MRMTIDIGNTTMREILDLCKSKEFISNEEGEAIAYSIGLAWMITREMEKGNKMYIQDKDGNKIEILLNK